MRRLLACLLFCFAILPARADQAIIVLDASGSMWGQIGGEAKMEIARRTLANVLGTVSPDLELGLIAYGHRDKGSCGDIELMVPPAAGTAATISAAANALQPKGKTPITDAIRQAASVLRYTEEKATVILVTDGIETCEADPCAAATELEQAGIDFTVHVVGFGLSSEERRQVACLAENTGGRYFPAGDAAALGEALTTTVAETVAPAPPPPPPPASATRNGANLRVTARAAVAAPPYTGADTIRYDVFRVLADGSKEEQPVETVYGGEGSEAAFQLPAGRYAVLASKELASAEVVVEVIDTATTEAGIVLNAGTISARAMLTETTPAEDGGVRFDITDIDGNTDTSYGPTRTVAVTAGAATVQGSLGSATASVPVDVVAGATIEVDVVLGAGTLVLRGKRSPEANDFDSGIRWDVTPAAGGEAATTYGGEVRYDLPAGDYKVLATLGEAKAEKTVSVSSGKTTQEEMVVATGKVIVHALFAEGGPAVTAGPRFDVLEATPGADGQRRGITTTYNDGASFDLPPGKYVLVASSDVATAEKPFEVVAGSPLDVSVVLNAGILALKAPDGDRLDLLSGAKDIYGNEVGITTTYGQEWTIAVPVGSYTIKVTKADGSEARGTATITAGQRTNVTVE